MSTTESNTYSHTIALHDALPICCGATAHAVGERLERLARDRQVLVITHSPQVTARGTHHWQVLKRTTGQRVATQVSHLSPGDRREEIARMLSGAETTEEARAPAERLIGHG